MASALMEVLDLSIVTDMLPVELTGCGDSVRQKVCLTIELETSDGLGRLWQAITSPYRLSAVYKASVVFITPETALPTATPVSTVRISVNPATLPYAGNGQVIGTLRTV